MPFSDELAIYTTDDHKDPIRTKVPTALSTFSSLSHSTSLRHIMPPIQADQARFDCKDGAELSPRRQAKPLHYSTTTSSDSPRRIRSAGNATAQQGSTLKSTGHEESRQDVESREELSPRTTAKIRDNSSSSITAAKIQAIMDQRVKLAALEGMEYNIIQKEHHLSAKTEPSSGDAGLADKLKDKITELQKELYAAKEVTGRLRAELAEAKAPMKPSSNDEERSPAQVNHDIEITNMTETFKRELNAHKREIAELKEKLINAEAASKVLVAKADHKEGEVQAKHSSTGMENVLSDKIVVVNQQLVAMARAKDKLEASLRSEITAANEQVNASAIMTNEYIHRVDILEQELRKANESYETLVDKVGYLEQERNSQTNKISHLNKKFAKLSKDKDTLEQSLRAEISSLTSQKEDLEQQLQESQESSAETVRKLNLRHAKLKAVHDETLKAQEEENAASKAREGQMKAQNLFLLGQVKTLKDTLGRTEAEANESATVYAHRIKVLTDERNLLKENEDSLVAKLAKVAKALAHLTMQQSDVFERASKQQELVAEETLTQNKIIDEVKAEYKELEREKREREILAAQLRRVEERIVERQKDRELGVRDALSQSKAVQRAQKERLRLMEEALDHRCKISGLIVKEVTQLPESVVAPEIFDEIKERVATRVKELESSSCVAEEAASIDLYEDIESGSSDSNDEDNYSKDQGEELPLDGEDEELVDLEDPSFFGIFG
jgi:hypothetical protein